MRTMLLTLLLLADLFATATNYPPTYYIPAGGQTLNNLDYSDIAGQTFYVTTSGSVNLGSNTYTLTYASLPYASTSWNVIFDATNLSLATTTNVNLFGVTPLSTYYPIKKFYINFSVVWDAGVPIKKVTYLASLDDLKNFASSVNFNSRANFNDTVKFYGNTYVAPEVPISAGSALVAKDTTGRVEWGCAPWCVTGNSGLSNANFLGNTDTVGLNFRVNNRPSGRIDYTLGNTAFGYEASLANTTGLANTAIGRAALAANTTGGANTAVGLGALTVSTVGVENTSIGYTSLLFNTTGSYNTAIGKGAMAANTTGQYNTAVGEGSFITNSTGSYNTAIGAEINPGTNVNRSIGIGYQATPSSNQLAIAGIRSISIPGMTSGVNYVLTDTSGTGDFVPRAISYGTTYTPVTGDSVVISTQSNTINPAGTIANFTIRLPGTPTPWQIITLTSTQIITALHWSTALSGDADSVESHVPTALTAGQAIKIQYNSTLNKWLNY